MLREVLNFWSCMGAGMHRDLMRRVATKRYCDITAARGEEKWSWSLSLKLVYPVLHKPPGATITSRSSVRIRINFWRMVGLYIFFGDWANALECWRSPSLRLVIPGIAVSPGSTHSDSRIVFVTGTVVKTQQPTNRRSTFVIFGDRHVLRPSRYSLNHHARDFIVIFAWPTHDHHDHRDICSTAIYIYHHRDLDWCMRPATWPLYIKIIAILWRSRHTTI